MIEWLKNVEDGCKGKKFADFDWRGVDRGRVEEVHSQGRAWKMIVVEIQQKVERPWGAVWMVQVCRSKHEQPCWVLQPRLEDMPDPESEVGADYGR